MTLIYVFSSINALMHGVDEVEPTKDHLCWEPSRGDGRE